MARRAFFSFHYQNDIWRVNQVRNSWLLQPGIQKAVWYDASLWEQTKLKGNTALMKLIDDGLNNTSVTVVLIGKETYQRKWVTYEIEQSHQRKNGIIGVHIHDLKNENERISFIGQNPFDHIQTKVLGRDTPLSRLYPTYSWKTDEGYKNLGSWIEQAAKKQGDSIIALSTKKPHKPQTKDRKTMSLLLPRIGVTDCRRALAFLSTNPSNVVGTFWVMCGYGFDEEHIPDWWIDIVSEDNQAQAILDASKMDYFPKGHGNPLYLGFCIIVTADKHNSANLSYIIQHLRMSEGIGLLKVLAEHNIPAHTEVSYPSGFLDMRYGNGGNAVPKSLMDLRSWSVQIWEDYCSELMANHGQGMLADYWLRSS